MTSELHFESQAKADQHQLDRQISTYADRARVTRSRGRVVSKLEQRRDALQAPVYKLPDEILSIVFKYGAMKGRLVDIQFSFLVSWVVSRWRRVALTTPSLWTNIWVSLPAVRTTLVDQERWTTLLHRAASTQLDLYIQLSKYILEFSLDYQAMDLAVVLRRCRSLTIASRSFWYRVIKAPSIPLASNLPLHELCLCDVRVASLSVLLDLLQACSCLVTLKVYDVPINEVVSARTRVVQLNNLSTLELKDEKSYDYLSHEPHNMQILLRCLRMPRLDELSLQGWDGVIPSGIDFSSVSVLDVMMREEAPQAVLIDLICGMPLLKDLVLEVTLEDHLADFPGDVSVPPLINIDFSDSDRADRFARWIVDHAGRNRSGGTSVRKVSMVVYNSAALQDARGISLSTRQWMEEKGIEVQVCGRTRR